MQRLTRIFLAVMLGLLLISASVLPIQAQEKPVSENPQIEYLGKDAQGRDMYRATFFGLTSEAYYPGTDSRIVRGIVTESWTNIRNGAGSFVDANPGMVGFNAQTTTNTWAALVRSVLIFDTSALPDSATIGTTTLGLRGASKYDTLGVFPDINVYSASPSSNISLVASDYNTLGTTAFSTAISYSGWSTSGYNDFAFNGSGIANISKTSYSRFGVRNANYDVANVAPTWSAGNPYSAIEFYLVEATSTKPILTVYYSLAGIITSDAASNIALSSARLNSTLSDDGGEDNDVRFGYGTTFKAAGDFATYDYVTTWVGGYSTGEHSFLDVSSLSPSQTYFYRVQARNSNGTMTSDDERSFVTLAGVANPTSLRTFPTANSISLSWQKGAGSTESFVRYAYDTYPASTSSGTQLYLGTGTSSSHGGLQPGTTVYYAVWGKSGSTNSTGSSTAMGTTTAGRRVTTTLPTATMPNKWFQAPDETALHNITYFYSFMNMIFDSMGMPRGTGWMLWAIVVAITGGVVAYKLRPSFMIAFVVVIFFMTLGSVQSLIPGWMLAATVLTFVGMIVMRRQF